MFKFAWPWRHKPTHIVRNRQRVKMFVRLLRPRVIRRTPTTALRIFETVRNLKRLKERRSLGDMTRKALTPSPRSRRTAGGRFPLFDLPERQRWQILRKSDTFLALDALVQEVKKPPQVMCSGDSAYARPHVFAAQNSRAASSGAPSAVTSTSRSPRRTSAKGPSTAPHAPGEATKLDTYSFTRVNGAEDF